MYLEYAMNLTRLGCRDEKCSLILTSAGVYYPLLRTILHLLATKYFNQTHFLVKSKPREDYLLHVKSIKVLLYNFLRLFPGELNPDLLGPIFESQQDSKSALNRIPPLRYFHHFGEMQVRKTIT